MYPSLLRHRTIWPTMDAASTTSFERLHRAQRHKNGSARGEHLKHRSRGSSTCDAGVRAHPTVTTFTCSRCAAHTARPAPPPPEPENQPEPRLPTPEGYSGDPDFCRAFLTRCSMHFALQPRTFNREESKVAFVLTLLSGKAALWGTAVCGKIKTTVAPRSWHSPRRWEEFLIGRWRVGRRPDYSLIYDKVMARCRIIRSNSAPWPQSAIGTRRRSGTCSCMGWLTAFKGRFTFWTFPDPWMAWWS